MLQDTLQSLLLVQDGIPYCSGNEMKWIEMTQKLSPMLTLKIITWVKDLLKGFMALITYFFLIVMLYYIVHASPTAVWNLFRVQLLYMSSNLETIRTFRIRSELDETYVITTQNFCFWVSCYFRSLTTHRRHTCYYASWAWDGRKLNVQLWAEEVHESWIVN